MKLREIRNMRGLSQREFAKRMDTSQPLVVSWESDPPKRSHTTATLKKICKVLDCIVVVRDDVVFIPNEKITSANKLFALSN